MAELAPALMLLLTDASAWVWSYSDAPGRWAILAATVLGYLARWIQEKCR